jgi:hypothetical protein
MYAMRPEDQAARFAPRRLRARAVPRGLRTRVWLVEFRETLLSRRALMRQCRNRQGVSTGKRELPAGSLTRLGPTICILKKR